MAQGNQWNAHVVVRYFESSLMEDSSSPFYLHNGDHPRVVLISHPLTRSNHNTWSRVMMMALTTKNKVDFVNDTIPCVAPNNLLFNAWTHYNSMVIPWLLNFVSKEITNTLMYIAMTCEIWNNLRDRFLLKQRPSYFFSVKETSDCFVARGARCQ